MPCEGPVEVWLSALLAGLRGALQWQVGLASGREQPPLPVASPPAAGTPNSGRQSSTKRKSGSLTRRSQTLLSRSCVSETTRDTEVLRQHRMSQIMAWQRVGEPDTALSETASWLLDHVGEVLDLVCRVRFTETIESAMQSDNPQEGLEVSSWFLGSLEPASLNRFALFEIPFQSFKRICVTYE